MLYISSGKDDKISTLENAFYFMFNLNQLIEIIIDIKPISIIYNYCNLNQEDFRAYRSPHLR